ncbi:unnamed protein product [Ceratitis capitata]|uniref:(Mediterranean fruit fly) hypothetical protein n=1 Tax=Ceratitis capitata TaxID=7213 RepID=A0A811UP36_CERCA|nr:unnamed protein product [Ceratitis capitata]
MFIIPVQRNFVVNPGGGVNHVIWKYENQLCVEADTMAGNYKKVIAPMLQRQAKSEVTENFSFGLGQLSFVSINY